MKELTSILKKKTWTGREVGLALLKTIDDQVQERKRNPKKRTFTEDDIKRMVNALDATQYNEYNEYCAIYSSVIDSFNLIQAMNQQFFNGYNQYLCILRDVMRAEDYYKTASRFPFVMTQKDFDQRKAAKEKEIRGIGESISTIILHAASVYYCEGNAPADVQKAIDALKGEPIKRDFVLETYTDTNCRYIFDNGMNSDETPHEEIAQYLNAKCGDSIERIMEYYKVFFDGEEGLQRLYKRNTGKPLPKGQKAKAAKIFDYMLMAAERGNVLLPKSADEAYLLAGLFVEPVKVKVEEITEDYEGDKQTELEFVREDYDEHFSEFVEDYPALYKALRADLEKHLPKAKKAKNPDKDFTTWGELADADYLSYAEYCELDSSEIYRILEGEKKTGKDLLDWRRAMQAGIAIYQGDDYKDTTKQAVTEELFGGIEFYMKHPDDLAETANCALNDLLIPALRFIYGYNEVLNAIRAVYEIPFLDSCLADTALQETRIKAADNILYTLYHNVFGTDDEQAKKRDFLRQYFKPIAGEDLQPTEEAREKLRERLRAAKGTGEARNLIKNYETLILDVMPGGGEETWRKQIDW